MTVPNWSEYNALARGYMDIMKVSLAQATRLRLLYEDRQIEAGIMDVTITTKKNSKGADKRIIKKALIKYDNEEDNRAVRLQAEEIRKDMEQNNFIYAKLLEIAKTTKKYQTKLLRDCMELYQSSALWQWCNRSKGLGPVAAMTLLGYIRPTLTIDENGTKRERAIRVQEVWSYFGLTPNAKMTSGQKSKFNPEIKGRMFLIARNVIMQNDNYYTEFYRAKKDYYMQCDSKLSLKGKKPGWLGWVDALAKLSMVKLIVSHAVEIILKGLNLPFVSVHQSNMYLPPKPESADEVADLIRQYRASIPELVRINNERFRRNQQQEKHD